MPACMSVNHLHDSWPEDSFRSCETEVTDIYEMLCGGLDSNPGPLEKTTASTLNCWVTLTVHILRDQNYLNDKFQISLYKLKRNIKSIKLRKLVIP